MKKILFFLPAFIATLVISCKKESSYNHSNDEALAAAQKATVTAEMRPSSLLQSVRSATSRFHSTTQAIMAGYVPDNHCVSVPGVGGMGYHWANRPLIDPVFDPLKPEVVLYATGPDGELRLVALEYVVINVGQPRPSFGDQLFDIGGAPVPAPHWTLHVWLYENNPSGMFTPFNPNISCP